MCPYMAKNGSVLYEAHLFAIFDTWRDTNVYVIEMKNDSQTSFCMYDGSTNTGKIRGVGKGRVKNCGKRRHGLRIHGQKTLDAFPSRKSPFVFCTRWNRLVPIKHSSFLGFCASWLASTLAVEIHAKKVLPSFGEVLKKKIDLYQFAYAWESSIMISEKAPFCGSPF